MATKAQITVELYLHTKFEYDAEFGEKAKQRVPSTPPLLALVDYPFELTPTILFSDH